MSVDGRLGAGCGPPGEGQASTWNKETPTALVYMFSSVQQYYTSLQLLHCRQHSNIGNPTIHRTQK